MEILNLEEIKRGFPGLSIIKGGLLYECCLVTLNRQKHGNGQPMQVSGEIEETLSLEWQQKMTDQLARTYADQIEATEHAAECLAILIALTKKGYTVIERSVINSGCDYWLGTQESLMFQKTARLEVSGIFDGDNALLRRRFDEKIKQTDRSDGINLPAYVSVTNFKDPHTKFAKK